MAFTVTPSSIPDVLIIQTDTFLDDRGYFMELSKASELRALGVPESFPQHNLSYSKKNVIRGLHYQMGEHAQGKLVALISGKVRDVFVDVRPESPTYKQSAHIDLEGGSGIFLYIPPGFAHGFAVLSDDAHFLYACTKEYMRASEGGIRYDDPTLAIDWGVNEPIVSDKDKALPFLS